MKNLVKWNDMRIKIMASYKTYLERKKNASPYAEKANCRKCKYGEWVKTSVFCSGFGKPRKIPYSCWDTDKISYCTQFIPISLIQKSTQCDAVQSEEVSQ